MYPRIFVALAHSYLEMGRYLHGLCGGFAPHIQGLDSIWVIVDRLTKSSHFIPVDTRYTARKYAQIYFDQIVTLHGVPLTIIYDRGLVFVSRF